jgi:SRSO17 transposase
MTVGVARQHAGITGQTGNCQTVVFCAYVTARAHTLFSFRLYLPKQWCADRRRRERAQVPEGTAFATKTEQGTEMVTEAGVPFSWSPATRYTAAAQSCGRPARTPGKDTCSRSR